VKEDLEFKDESEELEINVKEDLEKRDHQVLLSGNTTNSLMRIHPVYNGRFDKIHKAKAFFK